MSYKNRTRRAKQRDGYGRIGMGIDAFGGAVIDPTENVKALAESAAVHQDKIHSITQQLNEARISHQKETGELRERFQTLLRDAESARLNSIRQVDREDVSKMTAQFLSALATISSTANTTAETLRAQVATTAQTQATSLANSMGEVNKRLSAVELAQSEGKGKQQVVDPALTEALREVRSLSIRSNTAQGSGEGATKMWGYVVAAIGLILMVGMAMVTLGGVVVAIAYAIKK